jgi:hypothetical protein
MQTAEWMAYSCSLYLSDQNSYTTLLILSYGSRDMHFTKSEQFLEKKKKTRRGEPDRACTVQGPIWPAGGDG